jgi:hypothetical protein
VKNCRDAQAEGLARQCLSDREQHGYGDCGGKLRSNFECRAGHSFLQHRRTTSVRRLIRHKAGLRWPPGVNSLSTQEDGSPSFQMGIAIGLRSIH